MGSLKPGGDLYLPEGDNVVFPLIDSPDPPPRLRFVRSRHADLPQMEEDGAIKQLTIPARAGVADCTHIVFFSGGIIGADWNFYGPRTTALAHYINVRCSPVSLISIRPLLRTDVAEALERWESVRLVDLKIRTPFIPTVREVSGTLADAFESARDVGDAREVGLVLGPGSRARESRLGTGIVPVIRGLLSRDLRGQVRRFHITGRDKSSGRLETIDLLKEYLVFQEEVMKINPSTRALDPASAYAAIQRLHKQHGTMLEQAPTIY